VRSKFFAPVLLSGLALFCVPSHAQTAATLWLTTPDRSALLAKQSPSLPFTNSAAKGQTIDVDSAKTYQTIDGFGFALTGGSAQLIHHMEAEKRATLLHELASTNGSGIGVSYLRISVGSSDMNDHVYTYDDLPKGQADPDMAHFSLAPDETDVIPVLKEILAINPKIKILASPWSAPAWMKSNDAAKAGSLKPEYFAAYATYLVKYIQGMKAQGIPIDAITIQNEPLNENNTPSMLMLAPDQAKFIKDDLGPTFQKAGIKTKIVLYDHNVDRPDYPLSILKDSAASKYVDGSGFHLYEGKIDAMTQVHDAFPRKNLYFTEQMVIDEPATTKTLDISRPVAQIIIAATRNWSRNVLLWNLAADPKFGPHTNEGGCPICEGAITIDGSNVTRNIAWYAIAHASKFVPPSSVRIDSNTLDSLPNVAFKTPDGKQVLLVANPGNALQNFAVRYKGKAFDTSLGAGSVGTYVW